MNVEVKWKGILYIYGSEMEDDFQMHLVVQIKRLS